MNPKLIIIALISFLLLFAVLNIDWQSTAQESHHQKSIQNPNDEVNGWSRLDSPHEIARFINDHNDDANLNGLWVKFGIETESGKPGRCGCRGYDCPGTCTAQVLEIDSDSEQINRLILRISIAGEADCWFLVFEKAPNWRVVGIVKSLENQYKPPQHRIVKNGTIRWLVINELCGRGTGFVNYVERWYQLSSNAPKQVLSYGVSGHSVQGAPSDYKFTSNVVERSEGGNYKLIVHYLVLREAMYRPDLRWGLSQKHKASFIWDSELEQFTLDSSSSDLPKSEESPIIRNLNLGARTD